MSKLRYLKDEHVVVPDEIVDILNDVFMEGGLAYRSGGWHKVYRGYIGSHTDWEHTIATAYLRLTQRLPLTVSKKRLSQNATIQSMKKEE